MYGKNNNIFTFLSNLEKAGEIAKKVNTENPDKKPIDACDVLEIHENCNSLSQEDYEGYLKKRDEEDVKGGCPYPNW